MNIVYQYGLLGPDEGSETVERQLRLAHEYRNTLVELERASRDRKREVFRANGDTYAKEAEVHAAQAELDELIRRLCVERARTKSRKDDPALKAGIKEARGKVKAARAAFREARALWRADPDAQPTIDRLSEQATAERRELGRRKFASTGLGLCHGTYSLVEMAAEKSRKMPLFDGAEPNNPRFRRWDSTGRIGVQIQGGMTVADLFGDTHTQLRIGRPGPPPPRADGTPRKIGKKDIRVLWIRVGSNEDRSPVWAKFLMILHRPLPSDAMIMSAVITKRRIGPRDRWMVNLNLRMADQARHGGRAVAIDVGWRQQLDGVRVCAYVAERGEPGVVTLPKELVYLFTHPSELRAIRDKNFDRARAELSTWLKSATTVPEWLTTECETLHAWKSQGRLAGLCRRWKSQRFDGDEAAYVALEKWRYQDEHLWRWESDEREKGILQRKHFYRNLGAKLAETCDTVVFEKFDLRRVATKVPAEGDHENQTARRNRQFVAISELRLAVKNAFERRGKTYEEIDAIQSTHECHACGHVSEFNAAAYVVNQCEMCKSLWDQDENAAQVILARYVEQRERLRDERTTGAAREEENESNVVEINETRLQKSKRLATERWQRIEAARKNWDKDSE